MAFFDRRFFDGKNFYTSGLAGHKFASFTFGYIESKASFVMRTYKNDVATVQVLSRKNSITKSELLYSHD